MPGFFETIGAKIVSGRPISDEDTAGTRKVAVINEAFAKRFFKGQNPIGQHFGPNKIKYSGIYEIVGVSRDMRYMTYDYKDPIRPMFWVPEAQTVEYDDPAFRSGEIWSHYLYNIVIWAPGNQPGIEERVRKALASVDPDLVLYAVDPYSKVVSARFPAGNYDCDTDHAVWCAWAGAGSGGVVRSDGLYGGTADERDRCADGAGGGSRRCGEDGSARRLFTGWYWTGAWHSGGRSGPAG